MNETTNNNGNGKLRINTETKDETRLKIVHDAMIRLLEERGKYSDDVNMACHIVYQAMIKRYENFEMLYKNAEKSFKQHYGYGFGGNCF